MNENENENNELMNQEFPIGKYSFHYDEFRKILSRFPPLKEITETPIKIYGPFDGKINTIYHIEGIGKKPLIIRIRVSKAFRYEPIVKEKILYPFLTGELTKDTQNLYERIKEIVRKKNGSYVFEEKKRNPIIPVQNLIYYYEPDNLPEKDENEKEIFYKNFPYLLSIKDFIKGESFYSILQRTPKEKKDSPSILTIFKQAGTYLAKLHTITFDAFYEKITEIGSPNKQRWEDLFRSQWEKNFRDAQQYKSFQPLIPAIKKYYKDVIGLISSEEEAVLFHNDYQSQNIIVTEDPAKSHNEENKFKISAIIDFDNWRIGPRSQDFVKMEYWTIKEEKKWKKAFYDGYESIHPISKDMKERIRIYKILWFMLVYAFEMDKMMKNETNLEVDRRFPSAEQYITALRHELEEYL